MKSLEQDALRAQMVLSKAQEGRGKRGPLERLAEAPSPAPTPSPTPLEGLCAAGGGGRSLHADPPQLPLLVPPDLGPPTGTSPGRLVRSPRPRPALPPRPAPAPSHALASLLTLSFQGLVWQEV